MTDQSAPELLLVHRLQSLLPLASVSTLKKMVDVRRVRINGRVASKLKQVIRVEDVVEIGAKATPAKTPAHALGFAIVHEDADVLVVNKPPHLLTSTVAGERRPTLLAKVEAYLAEQDATARVGLIHRLDRDASGLLVFSKNEAAFASLKQQLFDRTMGRVYTAVVEGIPRQPQGRVQSELVELPDGTVRTATPPRRGEKADTHYEVVTKGKGRALLKVTLHTGRKHQIRVHLSELGTPIIGDRLYGKRVSEERLMLCATELSFDHPGSKQRVTFTVKEPALLRAVKP